MWLLSDFYTMYRKLGLEYGSSKSPLGQKKTNQKPITIANKKEHADFFPIFPPKYSVRLDNI